jgi:hypothetical protein
MMIPMMQAYINTGEFSIAKRLKSAVQVNLRFYSIYVVIGIFGLIYLVFGSGLTTRYASVDYKTTWIAYAII